MNSASTEEEYQNLYQDFLAIRDYKDAEQLANKCDMQFRAFDRHRINNEKKRRRFWTMFGGTVCGIIFVIIYAVISANSVDITDRMMLGSFIFLILFTIIFFIMGLFKPKDGKGGVKRFCICGLVGWICGTTAAVIIFSMLNNLSCIIFSIVIGGAVGSWIGYKKSERK